MQTLTIRWQRLVDASDETCPRCATTEEEVQRAFGHLKRSLAPVGIDVRLETERFGALDCYECGSCTYVCPSERPLVQFIQVAKSALKRAGPLKVIQ